MVIELKVPSHKGSGAEFNDVFRAVVNKEMFRHIKVPGLNSTPLMKMEKSDLAKRDKMKYLLFQRVLKK